MSITEKTQQTRQQLERMLDQRLGEVKGGLMARLDQLLDERILKGREAILIELERVPKEDAAC